jgi:hypothetical protein
MKYEYFDKKDADIESKLVRHYGDDIFRQISLKYYIHLQTHDYDFGFMSAEGEPSFILCKLHRDFEEMNICLVCSRPNSKDGEELLGMASQKATEMNVKYLSLLFIGDAKFVAWYTTLGFVVVSAKEYPNGELKAYSMKKRL